MEPATSPVIDLSVLTSQTGGDVLLEREVLALFAQRARADLAALQAASQALRQQLAHRMVGSARAVGAGAVAREAREVENGAEDLDSLCAAVEAACAYVAAHLAREPSAGRSSASTGRIG